MRLAEQAAGSPEGSEPKRICKKCLLREMADTGGVDLDKYLGALKEADKTDQGTYEKRLSVCRECEHLIEASCMACGCYVEFRAAIRKNRCPKKKW